MSEVGRLATASHKAFLIHIQKYDTHDAKIPQRKQKFKFKNEKRYPVVLRSSTTTLAHWYKPLL